MKGNQNNPETPKILTSEDRAPSSQLPESITAINSAIKAA